MDVFRMDTYRLDREEVPPCQEACPAGVDMRGYIYLLTQRRYEEAIARIREALPMPAVTGHTCPHPCENKCARREVDESVNINGLERFVADYWLDEKATPIPKVYREKIAIVGSGPAGLAASYELAKLGYPATVFETLSKPGGMLRIGVPEFRLPRAILDAQIRYIKEMGVEFETNVTIGKDLSLGQLMRQGYRSVFLAVGAQSSRTLDMEGSDLRGVLPGLDFLKMVNLKRAPKLSGRVLVIGGGNVAMDVALTARRLGAKTVDIYYRRSRSEMTAIPEEVDEAIREGIRIHFLNAPVKIVGEGKKAVGIECVNTKLGEPDDTGRPRPIVIEGSTFRVRGDFVIAAIGQRVEGSLTKELDTNEDGTIRTEAGTGRTSMRGVFAGGDAVHGPRSVVQAFASGRMAALSIHRYMRGQDLLLGRGVPIKRVKTPPKEGVEKKPRQTLPLLKKWQGNFKEVVLGFTEEQAFKEAQRCMACGSKATIKYLRDCQTCALCEGECPTNAITCHPYFERRVVTAWP